MRKLQQLESCGRTSSLSTNAGARAFACPFAFAVASRGASTRAASMRRPSRSRSRRTRRWRTRTTWRRTRSGWKWLDAHCERRHLLWPPSPSPSPSISPSLRLVVRWPCRRPSRRCSARHSTRQTQSRRLSLSAARRARTAGVRSSRKSRRASAPNPPAAARRAINTYLFSYKTFLNKIMSRQKYLYVPTYG